MVCESDEEYDAGLCYKQCQDGYKGIGTYIIIIDLPYSWLRFESFKLIFIYNIKAQFVGSKDATVRIHTRAVGLCVRKVQVIVLTY
jgi:hypothetical protein